MAQNLEWIYAFYMERLENMLYIYWASQCLILSNQNMDPQSCQNFNLLKPTGYVMHQQFNIQQLYVLPTLYFCVLYLSENKQRLVQITP